MILDSGSEQPIYLTSRCQVYARLQQDPASNYSNLELPSKFDGVTHFLIMMAGEVQLTQSGSLSQRYFENSPRVCSLLEGH